MNETLIKMGQRAQAAEQELMLLDTAAKNQALLQMAQDLLAAKEAIIAANQLDMQQAVDMPKKFTDRLLINEKRIEDMAAGLKTVAQLPDPVAKIDKGWYTADGLQILQKRVPLGVIGIIFEARPNVTVDAAALTFKSGNAVILRGGKEALHTNAALANVLRQSLSDQDLPKDSVQLITDTSHETAGDLMHLDDYLDVLIPRGGRGLIQRVVKTATVPVIETGAGNCHIYVDKDAQLKMAQAIVVICLQRGRKAVDPSRRGRCVSAGPGQESTGSWRRAAW